MTKNYSNLVITNQNDLVEGFKIETRQDLSGDPDQYQSKPPLSNRDFETGRDAFGYSLPGYLPPHRPCSG